nr:hypothetical protein [Tanacetum cinerariifolium]
MITTLEYCLYYTATISMGDANPNRTLGDYSKPSHEGYRNTIELPVGNNVNEPPKQSPFTYRERIPQPQALGTSVEARVRDYMAFHTERMERFENAIFKQREEINDRMVEMFGLFKELKTSRAPKKVLIREEAKSPVTKNINSISLTKREEGRNGDNEVVTGDDIKKTTRTEMEVSVKGAETKNGAENKTKNKPIKKAKKEETIEAPNS